MKKGLKKLIALFLTATFLVSGTGVVLAIHTCLASSTKKITLFSETGCCSKKENDCHNQCHDEENLESNCCSSEFSYYKLSTPFSINKSIELPQIDYFFSSHFELQFLLPNQTFSNSFVQVIKPVPIPFLFKQLLI